MVYNKIATVVEAVYGVFAGIQKEALNVRTNPIDVWVID